MEAKREKSSEQAEAKGGQATTTLCSSSSSSPSHEFSFTISLQPSSTLPGEGTKSPTSFAIDLSPADDIFFHGHLLPLHLISHLPVSPRSSTNNVIECLSVPNKDHELQEDNNSSNDNADNNKNNRCCGGNNPKRRSRTKSFSIFKPWRKQCEIQEREDKDEETAKKKARFDATHMLKRYLRMVRPLLFFRGKRKNCQMQRQPHSFSTNMNSEGKQEKVIRRVFSAPASTKMSRSNSGSSLSKVKIHSSISDSTMEDLHSAIEAAIAHCKSSALTKDENFQKLT